MASKSSMVWSIKELTQVLRERQLNKFDVNIGVSGKRGDGKSTILFKIFNSFKKLGFNPDKHQVYAQKHVINLLANEKFGFCWDDEAINSGYKRNFMESGQKTLIQVVTNYRDNYNIYASALPFFYSLDKDLRELIFLHIHIIERGIAVLLIPLESQIHSQDPWDTKNNIKVEEREYKRLEKNPNARFRYDRFTTFGGFLFFGDMTEKQRKRYELIKRTKRAKNFGLQKLEEELNFNEKVYKLLLDGKLTKDGLIQLALVEGRKYSSVLAQLNGILKDNGEKKTVSDFLRKDEIKSIKGPGGKVSDLVPTVTS